MRCVAVGVVCLALASCAGGSGASSTHRDAILRVESAPHDGAWATAIEAAGRDGVEIIESAFGAPFRAPIVIRIMPNRAAFDAYASANWGFPKTQCWMVGAAETEGLLLLSPGAWTTDACEHDPDDEAHIRGIVVHELVHTYHMQVNPSEEFAGVTDIDWFVEGLAVFVSGQFDDERRTTAARIIDSGAGPEALSQGWTGNARYAVAGSMVAFINDRWGNDALRGLLTATSEAEILAALDVSEAAFMHDWRRWAVNIAD